MSRQGHLKPRTRRSHGSRSLQPAWTRGISMEIVPEMFEFSPDSEMIMAERRQHAPRSSFFPATCEWKGCRPKACHLTEIFISYHSGWGRRGRPKVHGAFTLRGSQSICKQVGPFQRVSCGCGKLADIPARTTRRRAVNGSI